MVEQTDLVRLRMVRMSNVPDTLYMVNNAVPQCCHMISHQQISSNQSSPPSVIANETPGKASWLNCDKEFPVMGVFVRWLLNFLLATVVCYAVTGSLFHITDYQGFSVLNGSKAY